MLDLLFRSINLSLTCKYTLQYSFSLISIYNLWQLYIIYTNRKTDKKLSFRTNVRNLNNADIQISRRSAPSK